MDEVRFSLGPWTVDGLCIQAPDGNIALCNLARRESETAANARLIATAPELREALKDLLAIIDKAGLLHLSNGVQLGATSWYCKASDCIEYAQRVLAKSTEGA